MLVLSSPWTDTTPWVPLKLTRKLSLDPESFFFFSILIYLTCYFILFFLIEVKGPIILTVTYQHQIPSLQALSHVFLPLV